MSHIIFPRWRIVRSPFRNENNKTVFICRNGVDWRREIGGEQISIEQRQPYCISDFTVSSLNSCFFGDDFLFQLSAAEAVNGDDLIICRKWVYKNQQTNKQDENANSQADRRNLHKQFFSCWQLSCVVCELMKKFKEIWNFKSELFHELFRSTREKTVKN